MRVVKISCGRLLEIMVVNLKKHKEEYHESEIGYRKEVIKQLDKALSDAKTGKDIKTYFNINKPLNHIKDYKRVIKMLELSVDNQIELSSDEFESFVMDEWAWKVEFNLSNTIYKNK